MKEELNTAPNLLRALACAATSLLIGLTQGLTIYLVNNNLTAIQGELGATASEVGWLNTAYYTTALSAIVLLTKTRLQFGLRRFAEWSIAAFLLVSVAHLAAPDLGGAIAVRAAFGVAAAPLSTLAVFYMIEALPQRLAPVGLVLGYATLQFGSPLSRIIAGDVLQLSLLPGLQYLIVALALCCLAAILIVRLPQPAAQKVFVPGDGIAFTFYALALALLSVVCTQGRTFWWTDAGWLGWCLAGACLSAGVYVAIELQRSSPLLDLRWLCSGYMLRFVLAVLLFRIVLAEQPVGAVALMTVLGLNNDQMHGLFIWVAIGTAAGFFAALLALMKRSLRAPSLVALALIVIAALIDAQSTSLTRPYELYLSQALLAAATAMFLSSALVLGFMPVVQEGMKNLVSFLAAFNAAQMLGSLLGTALLNSYIFERQRLHFAQLSESISLTDPQVVIRVSQGAAVQVSTLGDPAQRALQGVAALAAQATRESFVLAYVDLFHLVAALALLGLLWLSLLWLRVGLRKRRSAGDLASLPASSSS